MQLAPISPSMPLVAAGVASSDAAPEPDVPWARVTGGWAHPVANAAQVYDDPAAASAFVNDLVGREANVFDATRDPDSGLTFDGVDLDAATGLPRNVRGFSAASKEALDIAVITKALEGNQLAVQLVGRGDAAAAKRRAIDILDRKMTSYEQFANANPGYGGCLPWFYSGKQIKPTEYWDGRVPGLDNGEWAWTLMTAEQALRDAGATQTADRYAKYVDVLKSNVVKMFYDSEVGKVRGDITITDPKSSNSRYLKLDVEHGKTGMEYLAGEHGVHEGSMLLHFITMYGKGLPAGAADRIWDSTKMVRVEHPAGTTWEGFWASSHESWAYMFLPLLDDPRYQQLFRIREAVRTNSAVSRGYPGLASSANDPLGGAYLDRAGIENITTQPIVNNHTFTPYGAFPLLLEHAVQGANAAGSVGLSWLANMLDVRGMYGPMGAGESALNDGSAAAPMKTMDVSFTNLIALMGGLMPATARLLKRDGTYDAFRARIGAEYDETFGAAPLREPVGSALPQVVPGPGVPVKLPPQRVRAVTPS